MEAVQAMEAPIEASCSALSGIYYRAPEPNSVHIHTTRETIYYDPQRLGAHCVLLPP
jgi:hypothetical protein